MMNQLISFIMNHWFLCSALVVIVLLILANEVLEKKKKATELSPQAVVQLMNHEEASIFDLRDKELYKKSHIIDALSLKAEELFENKMHAYKNRPVILVCSRGLQSQAAAAKLRLQGFMYVNVLQGGMENWLQTGLPVITGKKKG